MIGMFGNHVCLVFGFLDNRSLYQGKFFRPVKVPQSYPLDCKLGIKTFKCRHSGGLEIAEIENSLGTPDCQLGCKNGHELGSQALPP